MRWGSFDRAKSRAVAGPDAPRPAAVDGGGPAADGPVGGVGDVTADESGEWGDASTSQSDAPRSGPVNEYASSSWKVGVVALVLWGFVLTYALAAPISMAGVVLAIAGMTRSARIGTGWIASSVGLVVSGLGVALLASLIRW